MSRYPRGLGVDHVADEQRVHTHAVKEMAELASDVAAADNRYRFRHFAEFEDVIAGPIRHVERGALRGLPVARTSLSAKMELPWLPPRQSKPKLRAR